VVLHVMPSSGAHLASHMGGQGQRVVDGKEDCWGLEGCSAPLGAGTTSLLGCPAAAQLHVLVCCVVLVLKKKSHCLTARLCCAVLCCAVLCCVVLCCVVLCCVVLCVCCVCVVLCCVVLCCVVLCCVVLCCVVLCCVVLCCVVLCCAALSHACLSPQTLNVSGCTAVTLRGLRNLCAGMPYTELAVSYFGLKPLDNVVAEKVRLQRGMITDSAAVMVQKHFRRYRVEYTLGREAT
jgi:hypothetical protein